MAIKMMGGCQCGRIRFEAEVETKQGYVCHCRMCQRATGGVSVAFINLPQSKVNWEHEPDWYQSSPIASRPFCSQCGTPLGFRFFEGENIDLTIGSFDDPYPFVPTSHFGIESKHQAWESISHLPGTRSDEWEPTVKRWKQALGSVPDRT